MYSKTIKNYGLVSHSLIVGAKLKRETILIKKYNFKEYNPCMHDSKKNNIYAIQVYFFCKYFLSYKMSSVCRL